MSLRTLTKPRDAVLLLANLFKESDTCNLYVRESRAFKDDGWLSLGDIFLDTADNKVSTIAAAVERGAFEWRLPPAASAIAELFKLLDVGEQEKSQIKARRALDATAAAALRLGLVNPTFDPQSVEEMFYRRTSTVVADTSGVLQGGLDFVARFLHPITRIKVPAVVQMEIVNLSDRFLKNRRDSKLRRSDLLLDHLTSQGGQRVLLRLELDANTEIERTFLLGDPLRTAFQADSDSELKELNLSIPIRSYADRLILEAARQHQAQSSHGHKVQLLTSDQGLARMAIAEGITPLYFKAVRASDVFGNRLIGTLFEPFSGDVFQISLSSVLWELATAFGAARLQSADKTNAVTVSAFGEELAWSPFQSRSDLLWCEVEIGNKAPETFGTLANTEALKVEEADDDRDQKLVVTTPRRVQGRVRSTATRRKTFGEIVLARQKFKFLPRLIINTLLRLIDALDNYQKISIAQLSELLNEKTSDNFGEYRRFLIAANMLAVEDGIWVSQKRNQVVAIALRNDDLGTIRDIFKTVPSFERFVETVSKTEIGVAVDLTPFNRASSTFRILGETLLLCAMIYNEGVFPTPFTPDAKTFASIALRRFNELDSGTGLISTGAWLESLIRQDGIHPEISRICLDEASERNFLTRSTEGSTIDVRNDKHSISVLRNLSGIPTVTNIHLYRGDFLIPGKSSVSIRVAPPAGKIRI